MTAVSPQARIRTSLPVWRDKVAAKFPPLPRPPAYYVVMATVGVLNIVGLMMILSASSVAALSDYGSAWLYFDRQAMWALIGVVAFFIAARVDYHFWQKACPYLLGIAFVLCTAVLIGGVGINVDGSSRWLGSWSSGHARITSRPRRQTPGPAARPRACSGSTASRALS